MKRVVDILKYLCSIGAAIVIYITVLKAAEGKEDILMYVVASVFSAALAISLFALSSLSTRVRSLERTLAGLDDGYEEEDSPKRECAYCHAYIDAAEEICPYCNNESVAEARTEGEFFATEDPDYRGTDFSGEEYVSANTDGTEQ